MENEMNRPVCLFLPHLVVVQVLLILLVAAGFVIVVVEDAPILQPCFQKTLGHCGLTLSC